MTFEKIVKRLETLNLIKKGKKDLESRLISAYKDPCVKQHMALELPLLEDFSNTLHTTGKVYVLRMDKTKSTNGKPIKIPFSIQKIQVELI